MNHGLRTYQWSCRSFEEEEEEDDEIAVLPISIADSVLATLGYFMDTRPLQKHGKLSKKPSNPSV